MNQALFEEKMVESGWDGIVVLSAENVFYLSGSPTVLRMKDFQQTRPNSARLVIVVQPKDDKPTLISPGRDVRVNAESAWVDDVRGYQEYTTSPIQRLAQVLEDRGLRQGRIGLEMAALGVPQYLHLTELLPGVTFKDCGSFMAEVRSIKTPKEVAIMKEAVDLMDDAFLQTFTSAHIGDTEAELDRRMSLNLASRGLVRGSGTSFLFVGERATEIRQSPSEEKRLEPGDIVRTDYVAAFNNYIANLSRMAVVGEPSGNQRKAYQALLEVERATIQFIQPGVRACDVFNYCRNAVLKQGYDHSMPLIGHSVGLNVHEEPMLVASDMTELKSNMVICLEPVIDPYYQIQDQLLVTDQGIRLLSDKFSTEEMFVVE